MHWIKPSNFCVVEKDNDEAIWRDNDMTRTLSIGGEVMMIVATIMVTFKETTMNIHQRVTDSSRDTHYSLHSRLPAPHRRLKLPTSAPQTVDNIRMLFSINMLIHDVIAISIIPL